jgi:hypothetical protein
MRNFDAAVSLVIHARYRDSTIRERSAYGKYTTFDI